MYDYLKSNTDDVLFCDRTGNLVRVYLKGDVSVLFQFPSVDYARKQYRKFRKELEGIQV